MKILSIDPGFDRLGIAVLEEKNPSPILLYSSCFTTNRSLSFPKRLVSIAEEIERIILKYKPVVLAIETLFITTNQKTAMRVAEARGSIIFLCAKKNLSISEYTPLQIKMAVTGYGKADKRQVTEMIKKLISLDINKKTTDDEYDAIAVGLTYLASYKTAGM